MSETHKEWHENVAKMLRMFEHDINMIMFRLAALECKQDPTYYNDEDRGEESVGHKEHWFSKLHAID